MHSFDISQITLNHTGCSCKMWMEVTFLFWLNYTFLLYLIAAASYLTPFAICIRAIGPLTYSP